MGTPNQDSYLGAADAGDLSSDYNAREFVIQQALAQISTATLVKIVKAPYDKNGNKIAPGTAGPIGFVDVQPLVNQLDGYGQATPHGKVFRLSYMRYQSGNGAFITDPVVGDVGKFVIADRDTSVVRATGAQANPGSRRKFDKADGTFIGCTIGGKPSQFFSFLEKGFNVTDAFGNTMIGTKDGVLINGCLIKLNGDVVTKHGTSLDLHVNTAVTTGSDNTGPPP